MFPCMDLLQLDAQCVVTKKFNEEQEKLLTSISGKLDNIHQVHTMFKLNIFSLWFCEALIIKLVFSLLSLMKNSTTLSSPGIKTHIGKNNF